LPGPGLPGRNCDPACPAGILFISTWALF